ncbi:hypothetical protein EMCRGX_G014908 [Ephydatia muelleri]
MAVEKHDASPKDFVLAMMTCITPSTPKKSYDPCRLSQDLRLAQHCLEECDYDLDAAIAELLQLMDLGATDQLHSNTTGGAEVLPNHEDVGKRSSGSVEEHSSIDQTAAMVPPPPSSTKHSTSPSTNVSRKKLRKEAARRRRAGEKQQQQKPQEPTPTEKEREPPGGSICI